METGRGTLIESLAAPADLAEDIMRRGLVVISLVGVALVHVLDAEGKIKNAPLVGWLYLPLIIACFVLAEILIRSSNELAWLAAGALSAATLVGFALSRTVGLPSEGGHEIGKWTGDLGLSSMLIEGLIVWMVVAHLMRRPD